MKILQISAHDLVGAQVNGYMLHNYFLKKGFDSKMIVYSKTSTDHTVYPLNSRFWNIFNTLMVHIQTALSIQCLLTPLALQMLFMSVFRKSTIINIQLLHGAQFMSLFMLPILSRFKRLVLSIHDMFMMTGHCIYSMNCERWKIGCSACPDLDLPFTIKRDTSALTWKLKKWIFKHSKIDLIVGSPWQLERVKNSPILSHLPVHYIPYGVDTHQFYVRDKKVCRALLNIPDDADVLAFRSVPFTRNFKGTHFIEKALSNYQPKKETYLITFEGKGGLSSLRKKYKFVEFEWSCNTDMIAKALNAADIFLMPSTAEAFGLMAIEAMACGVPSIVFEGTALPETINAPHCGVAVPYGNANAITEAVEHLLSNNEYRMELRDKGLKYVQEKHTFEAYADNYLQLYEKLHHESKI